MVANIQTLRFFAASWVILLHMQPFSIPGIPKSIVQLGFAGADLFFVISGAIMAITTNNKQQTSNNNFVADFIKSRFARVYSGWWPYFFIYLALLSQFGLLGHFVQLPQSFFLLPQSMEKNLLQLTWTLSFELYFYIITASLLFFKQETRIRCAIAIILTALAYNLYLIKTGGYLPENHANVTILQAYGASPFLIEFFLGYTAASFTKSIKASPLTATMFIAIAAIIFSAGHYYQFKTGLDHGGMAGFFHYTERSVIFGLFSTCLVVAAIILDESGIRPFRWLQKLGDSAYSIYLSHGLCVIVSIKLCDHLGIGITNNTAASLMVMLFIYSWSLLSHHAIELRLYRLFKKILGVKIPATATVSVRQFSGN